MKTYIKKIIRCASCFLAFMIALSAGLNSCDSSTKPKAEKAKYEVVKESVVAKGYSGAQGLTSNTKNLGKRLAKNSSVEAKVFCTEPTFDNNYEFIKTPAVYSFSESTPQKIFEFTSEDLNEFRTWGIYPSSEGDKSDGLSIDAVLSQGDSIFYITNVSDKLFLINNGAKEVYLQSPELVGTSGLIQGKDGKLYLGQVPKQNGSEITNKRIISIDKDKSINTEVEIPEVAGEEHGSFYGTIESGQHLSMAESDSGELYLADLSTNRIYKWIKSSGLEVFLEGADIKHPNSIDISSDGNLFVLIGPELEALPGETITDHPPKLLSINKGTKEINTLYEFSDKINAYTVYVGNPILSSTLEEYVSKINYSMSKPIKGEVLELEIAVQDTTSGGE
ncbi:MAG: hypothetical protein PHW79_02225 [Candidatus Marinimicrobia bacterium]|nr:hypothetical protein [Candidatus Neomarinimicrobiota bacterium]